ncbi:DUF6289 family protein [Streptosporangium sp. NPDC051022]|uniref:DUF6289 family protein n=1 Tax=Streptosporangium sp. NPDC051022 TaxID=3155752 RepID=UPI0034319AD4
MIRRVLLAAVLAATGLVAVTSSPAQAHDVCFIDRYCSTTYYSDSALTVAVGGKLEDCGRGPFYWGEWGPYESYFEAGC